MKNMISLITTYMIIFIATALHSQSAAELHELIEKDSINLENVKLKIKDLNNQLADRDKNINIYRKDVEILNSKIQILKFEKDDLKINKRSKNSDKIELEKRLREHRNKLTDSENKVKNESTVKVETYNDTLVQLVDYLNTQILENGLRVKSKLFVDIHGSVKLKTDKGLFQFSICSIDELEITPIKDSTFHEVNITCQANMECCVLKNGKSKSKIKEKNRLVFVSLKGASEFVATMNAISNRLCG